MKEEDIANLNILGETINGFAVQENMTRLIDGGRVYNFEFEAIIFFGILAMRIGGIDNNSHGGELDMVVGFFLFDISELCEGIFLVHKSDKIKNLWEGGVVLNLKFNI